MQASFAKLSTTKNTLELYEYLKDKPRLNLTTLHDKYQANLLHHCAFNNELDKLKVFVKHMKMYYAQAASQESTGGNQYRLNMQAWVNEANNEGYLPAHYACLYGNVEMLHYLEELGTNMLYKSQAGETLLHMCAQNNQLAPMLYLTTKDIDFNDTTKEAETCLHQACAKGYVDLVGFLVALPQVEINALNHQQQTPLMLAVRQNKVEVVKRLLVKGADRSLSNNEGNTPLEVAKEKGHAKIVTILTDNYSCFEKTLILCNKKTVYRPEQPSNILVFMFVFLFMTAVVSTHVLINLELMYLAMAGAYYMLLLILYFMLLQLPQQPVKQPYNTLEPPICPECQIRYIPQSYHCFICNRCVHRYDHHCPWINNCLGSHNYGKFTTFLVMVILALLELAFLNVYFGFIQPSYRFAFSHEDVICYVIHGYSAAICLFVFPITKLLGSQLKSILLNKTGYQRHRNPIRKPKKQSLLNDSSTLTTSEMPEQGCSLANCCKICIEPQQVQE